jgi:hypothetical protein
MINKKQILILILLISTLLLMCKNQEKYTIESKVFAGNSYQNKLYSIWSLFYSDSIKSKVQRKELFRNKTSWLLQEEEKEKLMLLSNDYLTKNTFDVIDTMSIKGSWINYGENSDKSIDTLIELKINCVLGKIKRDNHVSWIIKRLETNLKHISNIKVAIDPDLYYVILNQNNIISSLSIAMQVQQKKGSSYGNRICKIDFEFDGNSEKLKKELQHKLGINTFLDTKKLGYVNAFEHYEGNLFTETDDSISK